MATKPNPMRLPVALHTQVEASAAITGLTVSGEVSRILTMFFDPVAVAPAPSHISPGEIVNLRGLSLQAICEALRGKSPGVQAQSLYPLGKEIYEEVLHLMPVQGADVRQYLPRE